MATVNSQQLDYAAPTLRQPGSRGPILAVIGAVGALALLFLIFAAGDVRTPSNNSQARKQISALNAEIDAFAKDVGRPPTTSEGFAALITAPAGTTGWNGPYADPSGIGATDPWGSPIVYRNTPTGWLIVSGGDDGTVGTPDDVSNNPRGVSRITTTTPADSSTPN